MLQIDVRVFQSVLNHQRLHFQPPPGRMAQIDLFYAGMRKTSINRSIQSFDILALLRNYLLFSPLFTTDFTQVQSPYCVAWLPTLYLQCQHTEVHFIFVSATNNSRKLSYKSLSVTSSIRPIVHKEL